MTSAAKLKPLYIKSLIARGELFAVAGNNALAEKDIKIAIEESKKTGAEYFLALAYEVLCGIDGSRADFINLIKNAEISLSFYKHLNNQKGITSTLTALGLGYFSSGNYPKAVEYYNKAYQLAKDIGHKQIQSTTLNNIGDILLTTGRVEESLDHFFRSLKIAVKIDDKEGMMQNYNNIGSAYIKIRKYEEAFPYFEKGLTLCRQIGKLVAQAFLFYNMGTIRVNQERFPEAVQYIKQSLSVAKTVGNTMVEGSCLNMLGNIYAKMKKFEKAGETYQKTREIWDKMSYPKGIAQTDQNIALLNFRSRKYEEVLEPAAKALEIFRKLGIRHEIYKTLIFQARALLKLKRIKEIGKIVTELEFMGTENIPADLLLEARLERITIITEDLKEKFDKDLHQQAREEIKEMLSSGKLKDFPDLTEMANMLLKELKELK